MVSEFVRSQIRLVFHRLVRRQLVQDPPGGGEHQLHSVSDGDRGRGTLHHRGTHVESGQVADHLGKGKTSSYGYLKAAVGDVYRVRALICQSYPENGKFNSNQFNLNFFTNTKLEVVLESA